MAIKLAADVLLREARSRAGISQRDLAHRAATSQSVVARIERGQTSPSLETLQRLLAAAGFELWGKLTQPSMDPPYVDPSLMDDIPRILLLSPEARLLEVANVTRFISEGRRALRRTS
jgi:transcriptional regulator with XRE-family HTH domain